MAQLLGQMAVGSIVKLNENGSPTNYIVVHQGNPSTAGRATVRYDASCTGTWILRQNRVSSWMQWNSSDVNTYSSSSINSWLNSSFISQLDTGAQSKIIQAKIPYCIGNGSNSVMQGENGLSVKVFLLSGFEVGFTQEGSMGGTPVDGNKLDYFVEGVGTAARNQRQIGANYWTRSPNTSSNQTVVYVYSDGSYGSVGATFSYGVRPAIILPTDLSVLEDGTILFAPEAPTLTVPSQAMQGQSIPINWTASAGADSYQLQRKADSGEWETIYTGSDLTFTDTTGSWNTVQYQVAAGLSGEYGEYATSAVIPVISASALVISGSDEDLGTITADIPYTVTSDTGNQITHTLIVNGVQYTTVTEASGVAHSVPVMDLPTGIGTIVITASVQAASGPVTATRTWTYTKTAQTFPASAGVGPLAQNGASFLPQTLAECVRTNSFWGGSLSTALEMLTGVAANGAQVEVGSYTGTGTDGSGNQNSLTFSFPPKLLIVSGVGSYHYLGMISPNGGFMTSADSNSSTGGYTHGINASVSGNTINWYSYIAEFQLNLSGTSYQYIAIG
ncbi:MAG: DUF6273 domain-containing protein [Oscillospiraceae bacterium]|nr:DUF6273 domain-containing protein [Oscillospiraceae bacterium]